MGSVGAIGGIYLYREYMRSINLHYIFYTVLIFGCGLSFAQLILVYRLNVKWGISDLVFALGDEVITEVMVFVMQMPLLVMCAKLCPHGVEGTIYALMTVVNNLAGTISGNISAILTEYHGITLTNFEGLGMLVIVTSLTSLIPVPFIPLTPDKLDAPDPTVANRSKVGGILCVVVLVSGLAWSILDAVLKIGEASSGTGASHKSL